MSATGGFVGIDVVDLRHPRCVGKGLDERFTSRVLNGVERAALASSADPDATLWRFWAAKEAAYKVVSKVRGAPPPFVHAAFGIVPSDPLSRDGYGGVLWEDQRLQLRWHPERERVAALAWDGEPGAPEPVQWGWAATEEVDPDPGAPLEALLSRLTAREARPVHSRPSALVRLAARSALARALAVAEGRVEVLCGDGPKGRMPPEAFLDGRPAPADVSLSHHGRWLAWAVRLGGTSRAGAG